MTLDTEEIKRIAKEMDVPKVVDVVETTYENLVQVGRDDLIEAKMFANTLSNYFRKIVNAIEHELSEREKSFDDGK